MIPELRELLTRERAPFEVISHREVYTAQERAATCHVPGRRLAKVVVVRDGSCYVMAVLPATAQLDLSELRRRTRRHDLAVASEDDFNGLFPTMRAVRCHRSDASSGFRSSSIVRSQRKMRSSSRAARIVRRSACPWARTYGSSGPPLNHSRECRSRREAQEMTVASARSRLAVGRYSRSSTGRCPYLESSDEAQEPIDPHGFHCLLRQGPARAPSRDELAWFCTNGHHHSCSTYRRRSRTGGA